MSSVSPGASNNVATLNHGANRFRAIDQRALIRIAEAEQHCSDIACGQCGVERAGEGRRIVELRSEEIKPRSRTLGVHLLAMPLCVPDRPSTARSRQVRSSWRGG